MTDERTRTIRQSYDQIADDYARRIYHELDAKPFDRAILSRFAKAITKTGEICDMGCGPGHVAQYLQGLGATVFGLDVSLAMVEQARQLNPGIRFQVGDMLALDLPDRHLAGIVAFYAFVNIPKEFLPMVFGEMLRVLQDGGLLLLAFHIGRSLRRALGTPNLYTPARFEEFCKKYASETNLTLINPATRKWLVEEYGLPAAAPNTEKVPRAQKHVLILRTCECRRTIPDRFESQGSVGHDYSCKSRR